MSAIPIALSSGAEPLAVQARLLDQGIELPVIALPGHPFWSRCRRPGPDRERLIEVNVTSPTGIQELARHLGRPVEEDVIAWVGASRPGAPTTRRHGDANLNQHNLNWRARRAWGSRFSAVGRGTPRPMIGGGAVRLKSDLLRARTVASTVPFLGMLLLTFGLRDAAGQ